MTILLFQYVPLYMTVFPVQFAKLSILWNPVIYICMNKSVSVNFHHFQCFLSTFSNSVNYMKYNIDCFTQPYDMVYIPYMYS